MDHEEYITLKDVEIGVESNSGLAVSVKINDEWEWVPLSQISRMTRNPKTHDSDSITVAKWLAEKRGWI